MRGTQMLLKVAHMSHVFSPSLSSSPLFGESGLFLAKANHVSHTWSMPPCRVLWFVLNKLLSQNIGVRMIIKGKPYTSTKQSTVYGFSYLYLPLPGVVYFRYHRDGLSGVWADPSQRNGSVDLQFPHIYSGPLIHSAECRRGSGRVPGRVL